MSLSARIAVGPPERRQTDLTPIVERRAEEPKLPRWLRWTRENESRGKSLDERRAA